MPIAAIETKRRRACPPLRRLARLIFGALIPNSPIKAACLVGALLYITLPWVILAQHYSSWNFALLANDRVEPEYFLSTAALSRGELGTTFIAEEPSRGLNAFSWPVMALHAAGLRLFGAAGFLIADGVAALLSYALLSALVRTIGWRRGWENIGALLALSGMTGWLLREPRRLYDVAYGWSGHASSSLVLALLVVAGIAALKPRVSRALAAVLSLLCIGFALHLYFPEPGYSQSLDRYPRYLVSNLFLYGWILCLLLASKYPRTGLLFWCGAGVGAGLTLQGNIYSFLAVLPIHLAVVAYRFWKREYCCGWSLLTLALSVCPFIAQRLLETPDIHVRLGLEPLTLGSQPYTTLTAAGVTALVAAALAMALLWKHAVQGFARWTPLVFGAMALATWFAPYLFALTIRKCPQPYHYLYLQKEAFALFAAWTVMALVSVIARHWRGEKIPSLVTRSAIVALLALWLVWRIDSVQRLTHPSLDSDLVPLFEQLDQPAYHGQVLGTLLPSVAAYWGTWHGSLLMPLVFATTLREAETDQRFFALMRELNHDRQQVTALTQDSDLLHHYLGHFKYHLRENCPNTWSFQMPESDRVQFLNDWEQSPHVNPYRCDLLVTRVSDPPPASCWQPAYRNASYVLYRKSIPRE